MDNVPKSEDEEPVPSVWRETLSRIVDSFLGGDYGIKKSIQNVAQISEDDALFIRKSIENYGEKIVHLPSEAWNTSVCRWTGHDWDVMVDLFTESGLSDLVMFVKIIDQGQSYLYKVDSVHVP